MTPCSSRPLGVTCWGSWVPMGNDGASSKPKDGWDKANVAGQLVSGVLLAVIAFVVKLGADNIANSLQTGQLVQSLIADLTTKNEKTRQDVALIALNYAVGDQKAGLVCEIAERIFRDREEGDSGGGVDEKQSLGSIAFATIAHRCPERADQIREALLKDSEASRARLRSDPDSSRPSERQIAPQAQLLARAFKKLVYIQFTGEANRELARDLGKAFTEQGFAAPGVERVAAEFATSIRFFHADDQLLAEQARQVTETFLRDRGFLSDVKVEDLSGSKFKVPIGQVEAWINFGRREAGAALGLDEHLVRRATATSRASRIPVLALPSRGQPAGFSS